MDYKTEYHLVYTKGVAPQDEVFASEIAALGRASALMGQRTNHDFCIRNSDGRVVHSQGSLLQTTRLFRGR
jgi:hypothetical protein